MVSHSYCFDTTLVVVSLWLHTTSVVLWALRQVDFVNRSPQIALEGPLKTNFADFRVCGGSGVARCGPVSCHDVPALSWGLDLRGGAGWYWGIGGLGHLGIVHGNSV